MRVQWQQWLLGAAVMAAGAGFCARADAPASQPAPDGSKTLAQRLMNDAMAQGRNTAVDPAIAAKESVYLLQTATKLDPTNRVPLKLLEEAASATHQTELEKDCLRKLIRMDPGDLVTQVAYLDFLASGKQSLDEREKIYAGALASKALHPQIRSRMAVRLAGIALERGDQTAAVNDLKQALVLDSVNTEALRAVVRITHGTAGQKLTAIGNLLTADPYDPMAWIEGARILAAANMHSRAADFLIIAMEQNQLAGINGDAELYLDLGIELAAAGRFTEAQPILGNLSQLADAPLSALIAKRLLANEYAPQVLAPKVTASTLPDAFTPGPAASLPSEATQPATTGPATQQGAIDVPPAIADAPTVTTPAPVTQATPDTQPAAPVVQADTVADAIRSRLTDMVTKNPNSAATFAEALWIEFSMLPSTPESDAKSAAWFKQYRQLSASGDMAEMERLSGWGLLRIGKLPQAEGILLKSAASDPLSELGLARVELALGKTVEAQKALADIWAGHPTGIFALQVSQTMRKAGFVPTDSSLTQELGTVISRIPYETFSAHRQVRDVQLVFGALTKSHVQLGEPITMNVRITNSSSLPLSVGDDGAIKTRVGLAARSRGMDSNNLGVYNVVDMQRTYRLEPHDTIEQTTRVDCGALEDLLEKDPVRNITAAIKLLTAPRGSAATPAAGLGGQEVTVDDVDRQGVTLIQFPDDYRRMVEDAATLTGDAQLVKLQVAAQILSVVPEQVGVPSQEPVEMSKAALREQILGAMLPLCSSPSPVTRAWLLRVLPYAGLGDKLDAAVNGMKTDPDRMVRMMWGWRLMQGGIQVADLRQNSQTELARLRDAETDANVKAWMDLLLTDMGQEIAAATQPVAASPTVKPVATQPDQGPVLTTPTPDTTIIHPMDPNLNAQQ